MSEYLLFGFGMAEITPKGAPVSLCGQWERRIATECLDPLNAVAFIAGEGAERSILVACDLCELDIKLVDDAAASIAGAGFLEAFDRDQLVISATHIHTGPFTARDPESLLGDAYDDEGALTTPECRAQIVKGITEAVRLAAEDMDDGYLETAISHVQTGISRRTTYKDGSCAMYGSARRPDFAGMEGRDGGPIQLLYARSPEGDLRGVIANVPCTTQCDENANYITADYWGVVRERLSDEPGFEEVPVLPLIRAAGDLSPHRIVDDAPGLPNSHGRECALDMGERVADAIIAAEARPLMRVAPTHRHIARDVELPLWSVTEQEYEEAKAFMASFDTSLLLRDMGETMRYTACRIRVKRYEDNKPTFNARVYAVKLGHVLILTNPFELFIEYADRIRMALPADVHVFDVELCDACCGYLATKEANAGGGYSAMIFSGKTDWHGGEKFVEGAIEVAKEALK